MYMYHEQLAYLLSSGYPGPPEATPTLRGNSTRLYARHDNPSPPTPRFPPPLASPPPPLPCAPTPQPQWPSLRVHSFAHVVHPSRYSSPYLTRSLYNSSRCARPVSHSSFNGEWDSTRVSNLSQKSSRAGHLPAFSKHNNDVCSRFETI